MNLDEYLKKYDENQRTQEAARQEQEQEIYNRQKKALEAINEWSKRILIPALEKAQASIRRIGRNAEIITKLHNELLADYGLLISHDTVIFITSPDKGKDLDAQLKFSWDTDDKKIHVYMHKLYEFDMDRGRDISLDELSPDQVDEIIRFFIEKVFNI
jgi:hypothetical protein